MTILWQLAVAVVVALVVAAAVVAAAVVAVVDAVVDAVVVAVYGKIYKIISILLLCPKPVGHKTIVKQLLLPTGLLTAAVVETK